MVSKHVVSAISVTMHSVYAERVYCVHAVWWFGILLASFLSLSNGFHVLRGFLCGNACVSALLAALCRLLPHQSSEATDSQHHSGIMIY